MTCTHRPCSAPECAVRRRRGRRRGTALVLVLIVGVVLVAIAGASLGTVQTEAMSARVEREVFLARLAAQSGISEALSQLKFTYTPMSGGTATAKWSRLGDGGFYYRTEYIAPYHRITCWGRVRSGPKAKEQTDVAPDDPSFDPTGWTIRAMEAIVKRVKYFNSAPMYVGNGGVEKPRGGFAWKDTADPWDRSTWEYLSTTSGYDSRIAAGTTLPFQIDARDHDMSGNVKATQPTIPYSIFASQNPIGQWNAHAFLNQWTESGKTYKPWNFTNPKKNEYPDNPPGGSATDPNATAFAIDPNLPDVQEFAWNLWELYGSKVSGSGGTVNGTQVVHLKTNNGKLGLSGSNKKLEVGTSTNPAVAFASGKLLVNSGYELTGTGILVIRDDYHPTLGPFDNEPSGGKDANLEINGKLNWTGLVIIAGWHPNVKVTSSGTVDVLGAFFGEDSVQSGGEPSLDSAQIQFYIDGPFKLKYCRDLFEPGGIVYDLIPETNREIVCIRDL